MFPDGVTTLFPYETRTITILDNVKISSTGLLTGSLKLSDADVAFLAASTFRSDGICVLRLSATGVSGSGAPSPTVKITGVWASADDTNYFKWQDTSDPILATTGVTGDTECSSLFTPNNVYVKLGQDSVLVTASDFIYITAKLVCYVPNIRR